MPSVKWVISDNSHHERVRLARKRMYIRDAVPLKILEQRAFEAATAEMLDEIHYMLRELLAGRMHV